MTRNEMVRMPPVFPGMVDWGRCERVYKCHLPEAKAEERMAAAWATLRLRVSDMVVESLRHTRHGF